MKKPDEITWAAWQMAGISARVLRIMAFFGSNWAQNFLDDALRAGLERYKRMHP